MANRPSGNRVGLEVWNVTAADRKVHPSGRKIVTKIATRDSSGRFLGPTNYRGSVVGS